jgi:hypothetical protein
VDDDRGTIRAWTMEGTTVEMQLEHGGFVEELHCQASVSQVMITVNNQGHILLLERTSAIRSVSSVGIGMSYVVADQVCL